MISPEMEKVLDLFAEGRKYYNLREFEKAKEYFVKALGIMPNDGPSKEYLRRCEIYIQSPPPEDWDGVFVMKSK